MLSKVEKLRHQIFDPNSVSGEVFVGLPPSAGLLRRPIPGERPLAHRTSDNEPIAILAQGAFAQRGEREKGI